MSASQLTASLSRAGRLLDGVHLLIADSPEKVTPEETHRLRELLTEFAGRIASLDGPSPDTGEIETACRTLKEGLRDPAAFGDHMIVALRAARERTRGGGSETTAANLPEQLRNLLVIVEAVHSSPGRFFHELVSKPGPEDPPNDRSAARRTGISRET